VTPCLRCPQPARPRGRYCSDRCRSRAAYQRRREYHLAKRAAYRAAHRLELLAEHVAWRERNKERLAAELRQRLAERRREMALARPRCVICSGPINWHVPNIRLDTRTCGESRCRNLAHRWFGAMKPRRAA
jgi:hypothetical protein